ncbi:hypothetical protein PF003_g21836 [Phytophthora fragariae]|nr:hypothetical protein PF003_g21836 [Phytophthora fragariae]
MNDDWREDGSLKGLNAGGAGGKARGKGKGPQFTRVIPKFLQKYHQPPAIQAKFVTLNKGIRVIRLVLKIWQARRSIGGKQQLFIGTDSKNRFGRLLRRVICDLSEEEMCTMSCVAEDIGTHSLRKGSSSYALGQVNGPTPVSVYLRMGQSLGKLKDRYIHFGEGADQLCGRMIAGLPFNSERFGVLPPHFPPPIISMMTVEYWDEIVSGYSNYPRGVQSAFPFLLASVIHHEQFLRESLTPNHPIFKARVFTANVLLQQQRGATVLAIGESPVCGLKATGIPAHLAVAKQVNELREEVANLHREIDELKTDMAAKLSNEVAVKVVSELRQQFVVNGVAPVTLRDIDMRIADLRTNMVAEFRSALNAAQLPNATAVANISGEQQPVWRSWSWGDGQICHAVPKDWEFPARASVKAIWNLWFFGDKDAGIRPYRLLSKQHDIKPEHRMRHSRVSVVMSYMEQLVQEAGALPASVTKISALQVPTGDKVFDTAFTTMLSQLYSMKPKRPEDLSCGTLYNRLCQYRRSQQSA